MNRNISRRDFLKLAGLTSLGIITPPTINNNVSYLLQENKKNVLIIVFDAFTASNISLYGYQRETTPNLAKLANRATVFHNHFSAGNYSTPGTASLLTGTLPWTHRAIHFNGRAKEDFVNKNIFQEFNDYYRIAFTHNALVITLLNQFTSKINEYISREALSIFNDGIIQKLFANDEDIATVGWARTIKRTEGFAYSLFLSQLYEKIRNEKIAEIAKFYPRGLPRVNDDNFFTLEQGVDSIAARLNEISKPFFGYFHFLPPHYPYKPHQDFVKGFAYDSLQPLNKPDDIFADGRSREFLATSRMEYDEFILNVDHEFKRLFDKLESSGLLDNTWVVLTSDHGEMFERGIWAHNTATLYQPVVRVPLLIFEPGNQVGKNIYSPTSAIDLMPTLLHVTGHKIPNWTEGNILPPYTSFASKNPVLAVQARNNDPKLPITELSVMLVQENYKLIYYRGYDKLGSNEEKSLLFDLAGDPEELSDISAIKKETTSELTHIIKNKLEEADKPYH